MKEHQVLCANCGSHDSRDFSYDSYWEEYTCICCGWVAMDKSPLIGESSFFDENLGVEHFYIVASASGKYDISQPEPSKIKEA